MSKLKVAAVQTSPVFGEVERNIADALALVPADCDLAVLPELFATGYQFKTRDELHEYAEDLGTAPTPDTICGRLTTWAADHNCTIVAGLAEKAGDDLFNSSVMIRPDGSREVYRKVHLFLDEKLIFTPGDLGFPVFEACSTTVGMMICFDWLFPEAARSLAAAGARILCHPSNLILPWCPEAMVTRSLENRVFTLLANRIGTEHRTADPLTFIGMSEVVTPLGKIEQRLGTEAPGAAVAQIDLREADPQVTSRNHVWQDRRPKAYRLD